MGLMPVGGGVHRLLPSSGAKRANHDNWSLILQIELMLSAGFLGTGHWQQAYAIEIKSASQSK